MSTQLFHITIHSESQIQQDYHFDSNVNINPTTIQQHHQKSDLQDYVFPLNQQLFQLKNSQAKTELPQYISYLEDQIKQYSLSIMNQYKKFRELIFNISIMCELKTKRQDIQVIMSQNGVVKLDDYQICSNSTTQTMQDKQNSEKSQSSKWKKLYESPIAKIKDKLQQQWILLQHQQKQKNRKAQLQQKKIKQKIRITIDKELTKIMLKRKKQRQKHQKLSQKQVFSLDGTKQTKLPVESLNIDKKVNKQNLRIKSRRNAIKIKSVQSQKTLNNQENGENKQYLQNQEHIQKTNFKQQNSLDESQLKDDEILQFVIPDYEQR